MSDDTATRELIAEARRLEGDYGDSYEVMCHMSTLADALEAALAYRPAPEEAGLLVLINEAITRLHASSIPLGMSEAQFNAATIVDVLRILTRPLPAPAPVGEVEREEVRDALRWMCHTVGFNADGELDGDILADAILSEFTVSRKVVS